MHTIEVDNEVLTGLSSRAVGFNVKPNDVLRQILGLPPRSSVSPILAAQSPASPRSPDPLPPTLISFIRSDRFQRHNQAIDRYLVLLGWLHTTHQEMFVRASFGFHRGSRPYFGKSEKEIVDSAPGSTARQIPQTELWALTTLDNKSKRLVLEDLLTALSYSRGDIALVLAELPDSGIRRGRNGARARLLANL